MKTAVFNTLLFIFISDEFDELNGCFQLQYHAKLLQKLSTNPCCLPLIVNFELQIEIMSNYQQ